jgi:hypothetical protein
LVRITGLTGDDGNRRWWKSWFEFWPEYEIDVVNVRDLGDTTLATLRALGHGAGSDVTGSSSGSPRCSFSKPLPV